WNGEVAGFALWFLNFSSFRGRHGIYLEDLFVRPAFRGKGLGKALMATLGARCVKEGWARFEWAVLDWNRPAIDFYGGIGANVWTTGASAGSVVPRSPPSPRRRADGRHRARCSDR